MTVNEKNETANYISAWRRHTMAIQKHVRKQKSAGTLKNIGKNMLAEVQLSV